MNATAASTLSTISLTSHGRCSKGNGSVSAVCQQESHLQRLPPSGRDSRPSRPSDLPEMPKGAKKIKGGKKAEQQALAKQRQEEKEKEQMKAAVRLQQEEGQRQILSQLMAYFEARPSEASFMLANIQQGYFDFERQPEESSEQRLPGHMNKVKLLSKDISSQILSELNPKLSEWLCNTTLQPTAEGEKNKLLGKKELNEVLGYLCGMDPLSAVPCKALPRLVRKMRERYEALGARGSSFECRKGQTLKDNSCAVLIVSQSQLLR